MTYNVTCSTDDKYVQHCMAMLCSLYENNKDCEFVLHLLHHNLSQQAQTLINMLTERYHNSVKFYDIDESGISNVKIASNHPDLSIATYYRLLLPGLLDKSIARVLYLDCDIIVAGDIKPLFQLELSGYALAAVKDCLPQTDAHRQIIGLPLDGNAFCAGILMINLDYWREHSSQENMLKFANEMGGKLIMEDQDVLNHEFRNQWFQLPNKYASTPLSIVPLDKNQKWADIQEYAFTPVIFHYAYILKPWLDIRIPGDKHYWKYVNLSGFPNPIKTKVSSSIRKQIRIAKLRYYVNCYIHPFVPDFIEIPLKDIYKYIACFSHIFSPKRFKEDRIKMWLSKYQ